VATHSVETPTTPKKGDGDTTAKNFAVVKSIAERHVLTVSDKTRI